MTRFMIAYQFVNFSSYRKCDLPCNTYIHKIQTAFLFTVAILQVRGLTSEYTMI